MLRNKIIIKKIRNIFILLMAIIIMLGVYANIRNSRAENVIQVEMEVADKNNALEVQTIEVEATETKDGNYLLELPISVNEYVVSKYYTTDDAEVEMEDTEADKTLRLTETEVANKKVQLQTDYKTKEVTTEDNQKVTLYDKEMKNNEEGEVIVSGYVPVDAKVEITEIDKSALTNITLPKEEQTVQKGYEVSVYQEVAKTETSETKEQSETETAAQEPTQAGTAVPAEQEIEKVEYDASKYGETLNIKTKNTTENTKGTIYTLTEDNQIKGEATEGDSEYIEDAEVEKTDKTVKYMLATENIEQTENPVDDENADGENTTIDSDENTTNDIAVMSAGMNRMRATSSETSATSGFLGNTTIQRQNIEQVEFIDPDDLKRVNRWDGYNNTGFGHSSNTTIWRDLVGSNHGSINGGATFGSDYLQLDGYDDWVSLGQINYTDMVTLDAIVMFDEVPTGTTRVVEKGILGNPEGGGYYLQIRNGLPSFSVYIKELGEYSVATGTTAIKAGEKVRITGTYDGQKACLYVNGSLVASTAQTGTIGTPGKNTVVAIGCNPTGNSDGGISTGEDNAHAKMKVYSAGVYHKALLPENLKGFNPGLTTIPHVSSYDVSKGASSSTLTDLVGVNNGKINGATLQNGYLQFDGVNDWVNLGEMNFTDKVTLDATISMQSLKSGEVTVLGNPEGGGINLVLQDGKPGVTLYNETAGKWIGAYASTALTAGIKTRITVTYDGTVLCLYINGTLVKTNASAGKIKKPANNTVMAIGANPTGTRATAGWANINLYSANIYNDAVWDVSANNDNSIVAWATQNNSNGALKVNVASYNTIYANTNASYLFANIGYSSICTETTTLKNLNALHTAGVTNMNCMFYRTGYRTMTSLDLGSNFDTSSVTTMQYMFRSTGYTAMINLKLGDYFDTSGVIYMNNMFTQCGYYKLTELNLGVKFDTRKVINMNKMFYLTGRYALTKLDLSSGTTEANTTQFNTSNVTNMSWMFSNCGRSSMATLNLGNNFDTSNVTDMSFMFDTCGDSALTEFNIGKKFNTSKVKDMMQMFKSFGTKKLTNLYLGSEFYTTSAVDMYRMFYNTGSASLTSLDLGPAFTSIPSNEIASKTLEGLVTSTGEPVVIPEHKGYQGIFDNCGKSGGVTIYAPESIFYLNHYFKLNSAATTEAIEYTRGTINPKYRTEWEIEKTEKNIANGTMQVTLRGKTNSEVDASEYASNVTSYLSTDNIKIMIDGTDITSIVTKSLASATTAINSKTGKLDVLQVLTISNFTEATRRSGKSYKEWSGNIYFEIEKGTLSDVYGNRNTAAAWSSSVQVESNNDSSFFADLVKPEFTYIYADSNINYTNKTLTVEFSVTDKYFSKVNLTTAQMATQITIAIQGEDTAINSKVTKTVTKISDVTETRSGTSVKIGEKYRLVIGNLQQSTTAGKYRDYSGPMQIMFPKDMAVDKSGNGNNAQTITIGINYQGETNVDEIEGKVVDVVNPEWKVQNINVDQTNKKVTVDIVGTDKYYKSNSLDVSKIKVLVDGEETTGILKELSGATYLTERRNGANVRYGVSYTLTLTGFEQAEIKSGKKYLDWSGNTSLKIEAGTLSDEHNSNLEQTLSLGEIDLVNPSLNSNTNGFTYDAANAKATVVVNATDKYFGSSTLTSDNITLYLNGNAVTNGVTKTVSTAKALTETRMVNGTATQVQYGNQYIITVTGVSPNYNCAKIRIAANVATDKSGNKSAAIDVNVYNRMKSTANEPNSTSGFLGNTTIQRQNIEQVEFIDQDNYKEKSPLIGIYSSSNKSNNSSVLKDRGGNNNGRIYGATFKSGYLQFDGVDDWVNLGRIDLDDKFTLDVTMSALSIKSGEVGIISNWELGGIGLGLDNGKPELSVWSSETSGYLYATAPNALTVGEKTRITGTYDGKNMCLYINGTLVATTSMTGKIGRPESNTVMAIGVNPSGEKPYDGTFANMNLYSANIYNDAIWDVSAQQDSSIIAWTEQSNSNGALKVNISSQSRIFANVDSSNLFALIGYSENCTATTTIKNISALNTTGVTNMSRMFYDTGFRAMTSLDLGSNFDTSSATDMKYMFRGTGYTAMTSIKLGDNFNTCNVTDMSNMFYICGYNKLTELNLGSKFETSKVTNMGYMFYWTGLKSLESFNMGEKFDTSNVTNMEEMFDGFGQNKLKSLDLGEKFDTSKVTNMWAMFSGCGTLAMTSFNLGNKFNTSNVINMANMFNDLAWNLQSLELGEKFDTGKVTNMNIMFRGCGKTAMTSLDLGPAFTNIATTNTNMFLDTGKSGALVIHAAESIFQDKNNFKLNSDESTGAINYTRGTIEPKYRTEWLKESTEIGTIIDTIDGNKEKPSIAITLRGTTNRDVPADEYTSDVSGTPSTKIFKILIDGTDVTSIISKRMSDVRNGTNTRTGAKDTIATLILYNFEEVSRRTGKSYKEWSGNITVQVAQGTLEDSYGNCDVDVTSSGQRADYIISDSTKADKNGSNALFADVIKPEFTYKRSDVTIVHGGTNERVEVTFDVVDKYFASTTLEPSTGKYDASQITVGIDDYNTTELNKAITKTLTKVQDLTEKRTGSSSAVKIGSRYKLTITGLDQGDGYKYSGYMTLSFKAGAITDKSGNKSNATSITIGRDEPGNTTWVKASTLYDSTGNDSTKLHIGDFVQYDAGTWTQDEINSIKTGLKTNLQTANGSTSIPTNGFQFGGYVAGGSRNGNATPHTWTAANGRTYGTYLTDTSTNSAVTGWRVFDINGDKITLISAGDPETYYHPISETENGLGYASEYILTGSINSGWTNGTTQAAKYQKRDWSIYLNSEQKAESVTILTKPALDKWYTKYLGIQNADVSNSTTFRKIYEGSNVRYENLIENYSYNHLAISGGTYSGRYIWGLDSGSITINDNGMYESGVRPLVTLSSDALLGQNKVGTKTLKGGYMDQYGGTQTYNVWDLKTDKVVDVVDPVWSLNGTISGGKVKIRVTDKYLTKASSKFNLTASNITVYVNDVASTAITKTLSGPTEITADKVYEYTLTLGNITPSGGGYTEFTPIDTIVGGKAKYRNENGGKVQIEIAAGVVTDAYGNSTKKTKLDLGNIDSTKPEIFQVQKTKDTTNKKETIIFNVTDKNYNPDDLITTDEMTVWMDGVQIDSKITKKITKTTAIRTTLDGTTKTVGHQYTVELSGFEETDAVYKASGRSYREYSGTLQLKIDPSAAKDKAGNTINPSTTTIEDFVDFIKPEIRYTYSATDINKTSKTFTMKFEVTDKYYNTSNANLTINDLTIKIDGKDPDWYKIDRALSVENINSTINGTSKVVGKRYTLTLSRLEQFQIKDGENYLDYSGVISVAIPANKAVDTTGNKNNAITLTSGISVIGSTKTGSETVVDVVSPIWILVKDSLIYNVDNGTASFTVHATDKYFKTSTLTPNNITLYLDGQAATGVTKTVSTATDLTETRVSGGVSTTVKYGAEYTVILSGIPTTANTAKVQIAAGTITDNSGNTSLAKTIVLYSRLKSTSTETETTSGFLGNTNIQRQNVDQVEFSNSIDNMGVMSSYDAKNNSGSGHSNDLSTWRDLTGDNNGKLIGGSFKTDYLALDGVDDWVNLGRMDLSDKLTLDATITMQSIKSGEIDILANWEDGGIGLSLEDGKPYFGIYNSAISGYTSVTAPTALTVGTKTHITGTYDGTTMCLYINGKLVGSNTMTGKIGLPQGDTVMAIGCNPSINQPDYDSPNNGSFANMNVYSVNIYNKALTAKEVFKHSTEWDVSAASDNSIIGSYEENSNGTVKVTIASNSTMFANQDGRYLFESIGYSDKCTSTETIKNINLLNVNSTTRMDFMFDRTGYKAMTSLDLGSNFDTSKAINMKAMFQQTGNDAMTDFNLGTNFDTSNVTDMDHMFASTGFTAMTKLDLGSKFNTSKVTDMSGMFNGAGYTVMETLNLGDKFDTSNVTDMNGMFGETGHGAMKTLNLGSKFNTSKVTNMSMMFMGTGYSVMETLNLGNNFNTSNVTDMRMMFARAGSLKMTSLDLGDLFYTTSVTNMELMFRNTGSTAMTSLDLGPAFTNIASTNTDMFTNTGKSGAITIYAPESIFYSKNDFKLSSSTNASAINYTRGTIEPKYRTEWKKESVVIDKTDATNPKIKITLRGTTNPSVAKEEYTSDVTSSLAVGNIKVLIDGTDITSKVTKELGTATQTTNSKTSAKDVLQTITLSKFTKERPSGKSFDEWAGNITVQVAQKTLKDKYGNANVTVTSAGARADNSVADTTKVSQNTTNSMFADFIKPSFTYVYSSGNIDHTNKTLTVEFSVTDKYFASTTLSTDTNGTLTANQTEVNKITVAMKDDSTTAVNSKVTKKVTQITKLTGTVDGRTVTIGYKYKLVIGNIEQTTSTGGYRDYSGPISITIPKGVATDASGNTSDAKVITIGINEPDSSGSQQVVDVVDPVWSLGAVDLNAGTVKLRVKDKYLTKASSKFNLTASSITVYVNGVASTAVTKEITAGPTEITANKEYEYTIKIGNLKQAGGDYVEFTPTETIVGGKAKYRAENGGNVAVEIAKGAVTDAYGNSTQKQKFDVGIMDGTSPEVYLVQKTQNATAKTETIIFNVTDLNYDPTDLVTADEMTTWIDGVQVTAITKQITTTTAIKTTINGTVQTVGHQYTVVLGNFVESNVTFKASSRDYREYSGTLELRINANAAKDKFGNTLNTSTTTLSDFVDFIKPEIKYTYSSSDISYTGKTFTMEFDVMDKYLNTSSLSISDLNILIDGVAPNWDSTGVHGVTKTLELKTSGNKTANINGTTKTVGKHYVLTLSHLEQLEKLAGKDTMDYSGVITVAIPANKVTDTAGNKNDAITLTSGISVKGGTTSGSSTVVDVVDPIWERVSSSASAANQTATITVKGTDKYFKSSSLTADKIKVFVNGSQVTSNVTVTVDSNKTDVKASDGVTKIGEQYVVKVSGTGLAKDANQIKIQIQPNTLLDNSNNTNKATDLLVYNTLIRTYTGTYSDTNSESKGTSGFLGSASSSNTNIKSIQRQNIDNITFMNEIPSTVFDKSAKKIVKTTAWDVSAQQDNSIIAWYTTNSNGSLKVYIGSDYEIFGNYYSTDLFSFVGYSDKCTSTETITNLALLNVGSVVSMYKMFYYTGYRSMTKLDLGSDFDTSNVSGMNGMFQGTGYTAMTTLNLGTNFNTSQVTTMGYMFYETGRQKLTTLNLGSSFYTSKVTDMQYMFYWMASLTTLNLGNNFDTSNVTNMAGMFWGTGSTSNGLTKLDLGTKFNTAKVTNMEKMFRDTGSSKMTSLDLGDLFYTTNVTNMAGMFSETGNTLMTSLDLGPAFTKIASVNTDMFTNTGKSGAITIYAPESIFYSKNDFKLSSSTNASAINYTRGTIDAKYRTEWKKESVTVDTTTASNPKINIQLRGTTNTALAKEEYTSDVTSSLAVANIKILVDGTDITSQLTKTIGTATQTTNSKTSAKDVLQTITLSNFAGSDGKGLIVNGKSYREWSGNITVQVAQGTLKDKYGNGNVVVTSAGQRADHTIAETTKVSANTANTMFMDYIKPEIRYNKTNIAMDHGDSEKVEITFDVVDKYFASTTLETTTGTYDASQITVGIDDYDTTELNKAITKTLTKVQDLTETRTGFASTVKIGTRYKLTLTNLDKGDGYKYSGYMTLSFKAGAVTDTSGNKSNATSITIGRNEPGGSTSDKDVVDVVDPVWSLGTVDLNAGTVELIVKDKFLTKASSKFNLVPSNITVYVNGVASTAVTKEISGPTEKKANQEYAYTLKLGNIAPSGGGYTEFTPTETIVGGTAKYRNENGGDIAVEIAAGAVTDAYGNSTQKQKMDVGNIDGTGPEVYLVQKTQNATAKTETIIFNVTDKNYDPTDLVTADEMTTWIDGVQVTAITKQITTTTAIKTTINGTVQTVGHQYTVVLGNFVESNATFKASSRDYREYSGTLELRINANAAKDKFGNTLNTSTTTLSDFVDFIKPEIKYTYSSSDISYTGKTFTMEFDVMDKYLNTSSLSISDLNILIDGVAPNWDSTGVHGVTKTLELKEAGNKTANINGTTKTVGKHYVLTLSHLEQLEKLAGKDTMDYSGVITVAISANKVTDTAGNKNDAITLTSGISVKGGTTSGSSTVVDVVDPIWERVSSSASAANQTATITVKGTDKYFKSSSLTADKIKVFVNGSQVTSNVTVTVDLNKTDVKASDGVTKIGEQYVVKVSGTGLAKDANQIKIQIQPNTLLDNSNNTNKATDLLVYNTLISAASETRGANGFLGSANSTNTNIKSIQRQNIDNVTFANEIPSTVYDKSAKKIVGTTAWDVSAQRDNSIIAWYTTNANGTLKVYIGSDYEIFGNYNSSCLFAYVGASTSCTSAETITNISLLNVGSVVNMYAMFDGTGNVSMTKLDLGSNFDTSNVTNMGAMFWNTGYYKMTTLNLGSSFNTSKVTDMHSMFYGTGYMAMTALNLGEHFDTSKVTNMQNMFYQTGRQKLTTLDLGSKFNTSKVTNMAGMFNWMGALKTLNLGSNFDTSNVTNMHGMFWGTGNSGITSFSLGTKFNTSKVENMNSMFYDFALNIQTLDLGDLFYTTNVKDMANMFRGAGAIEMTSLDLGPAFIQIPDGTITETASDGTTSTHNAHQGMFTNTGKSGATTIHAPEAIFYGNNYFKYNADATASAINYTRGTIEPKYRTEWKKESVTVDTTTASNPKIKITLRGTTNTALAKEEYTSDVTSLLNQQNLANNIKILIDGTDITSKVTKEIGSATQTTNAKTGAKDVLQTITISKFEQARESGKSYKEWSGNITIQVAQKTLKDKYGNSNVEVTSAGARADNSVADTTKVSQNTTNSMFADFIKPEITYVYSTGDIDKTTKTLTVEFTVADKYFASTNYLNANGTINQTEVNKIEVAMKDDATTAVNTKVTKTLTKTEELKGTVDGKSVTIGYKFKLVIGKLEQSTINGEYRDYSGPMTIKFPKDNSADKSGNKNNETVITIGINEPDGTGSQEIVDVVDPIWQAKNINIDKTNKKVTVELWGTDKYYASNSLTTDKIKVTVDGEEATSVTKTLDKGTSITYGIKYMLTLTNFEQSTKQDGKDFLEWSGTTKIEVAKDTITDRSGNTSNAQTFELGHVDFIKPRIERVGSVKDAKAGTETITFNAIDKYMDTTSSLAASDIKVYVDKVEATGITKTLTKVSEITATVNNKSQVVGQQYQVVLSGFKQNRASIDSSKNYSEWSGTTSIEIAQGKIKDTTTNSNDVTTVAGEFVDYIAPEVTYKYASSDINYTDKTYVMEFEITDKYYDSSKTKSITSANLKDYLTIQIDGVDITNNSSVTKEIESVTDVYAGTTANPINKTVGGTVQTGLTNQLIGKHYKMKLSNLQQVIKTGNTLDYSGYVTVAIKDSIVADTSSNVNAGTTLTSGVDLPGGTSTGTIVDVVDPMWEQIGRAKVEAGKGNASMVIRGTDKYLDKVLSALTTSNSKVYVNGELPKTNVTLGITEDTSVSLDYGKQYKVSITGFDPSAYQVSLVIQEGALIDKSGNRSKEKEFVLFSSLAKTTTETNNTSGFLGSASSTNTNVRNLQRKDIEQVVFEEYINDGDSTLWDVSALQDRTIMAWYEKTTRNTYVVHIGSQIIVNANVNSTNLFRWIGSGSSSVATNEETNKIIKNIELLHTDNVTNMSYMFASLGTSNMTTFSVGTNFDTTRVTNMEGMFYSIGSNKMTSLDLGEKFETNNVQNMQSMFESTGYTALTSLNLGEKFDTSKVENMSKMFKNMGHNKMKSFDVGENFYVMLVTDMTEMFRGTGQGAMTALDLGVNFTRIADSNTNMFTDCGTSDIVVYAPELIYLNETTFKLGR